MSSRERAEVLALRALGWIAESPDRLGAFLAATGSSQADLRDLAGDPHFLGAVLDFLLTDDALVVEFCQASGLEPTSPMVARSALPGGEAVHWT